MEIMNIDFIVFFLLKKIKKYLHISFCWNLLSKVHKIEEKVQAQYVLKFCYRMAINENCVHSVYRSLYTDKQTQICFFIFFFNKISSLKFQTRDRFRAFLHKFI